MTTHNTAPSPNSPVAVKISFKGKDENRKFKLTLKDLGPSELPAKLCALLAVSPTQNAVFERYSDSSASFITLDASNPSVYKQLYRAAKAKGKLRLRVTITDASSPNPGQEAPDRLTSRCYVHPYISDPANSEPSLSSRMSTLEDLKTLSAAPSAVTLAPSPKPNVEDDTLDKLPQPSKPYFWPMADDSEFSEAAKSAFVKIVPESTSQEAEESATGRTVGGEAPVPRFFSAREHCLAELAGLQYKYSLPRIANKGSGAPSTNFTICCNNCDNNIPDAHWHCAICDDGDFDLCEDCVEKGTLCGDGEHWLIKRSVENGNVINSTTAIIAPRKTNVKVDADKEIPGAFTSDTKKETFPQNIDLSRTCNSCVNVFDESNFVTCTTCEDYDLCIPCHVAMNHGHHPNHAFEPASKETILSSLAMSLCAPGRNLVHHATCDGCEKTIYGVRHKCLNCPDWDYCSSCVKTARRTHPGHRMVPLYERLPLCMSNTTQQHHGIYCDGPLCKDKNTFIIGDRYKCAVCHDTDFCANCEALPRLAHNSTHPLLKFKTPVRNVSVSTFGEKQNGEPMCAMGDRSPKTSSKSTETNPPASSANAATQVQTVAEVKPTAAVEQEPKAQTPKRASITELEAYFVRDTIIDGSVIAPATRFNQTWTLRNPGPHAWPAGCAVFFIGGDGMLDVDRHHPSLVAEIRKAVKSNTIDRIIEVGEEVDFEVLMRTSEREGHSISYWRLKTPDGTPFGHKLWCDVNIKRPTPAPVANMVEQVKTEHIKDNAMYQPKVEDKAHAEPAQGSQMIFPKLDKESPVSSTHEAETVPAVPATPAPTSAEEKALLDDMESLELDDDSSDEGFLTDEEYELIASGDEMEVAKNGKK